MNSSYENITFGMDNTHLMKENPHSKDALISQSPIVVFKAATVLLAWLQVESFFHQAMLQARKRIEHIAQPHEAMPVYTTLQQHTVISFKSRKEPIPF